MNLHSGQLRQGDSANFELPSLVKKFQWFLDGIALVSKGPRLPVPQQPPTLRDCGVVAISYLVHHLDSTVPIWTPMDALAWRATWVARMLEHDMKNQHTQPSVVYKIPGVDRARSWELYWTHMTSHWTSPTSGTRPAGYVAPPTIKEIFQRFQGSTFSKLYYKSDKTQTLTTKR